MTIGDRCCAMCLSAEAVSIAARKLSDVCDLHYGIDKGLQAAFPPVDDARFNELMAQLSEMPGAAAGDEAGGRLAVPGVEGGAAPGSSHNETASRGFH